MFAIIYDGKKTYASPIFAVKDKGWRSEIIAFDSEYTKVKRIKIWLPQRKVFLIQGADFNGKKGLWRGYEWVICHRGLMRALRFGKSFPIERYLRFSDFVHRIELPEWFEIEDQNEAYALAEASLDFHDATIIRADQTEDDMEILFSCWGCYITVRFLHILDANIVGQAGLILDSEIKVEADGIRWTITDGYSGWTDGVDYDRICEHAYIKCKRIRWKLEGKSNPVL